MRSSRIASPWGSGYKSWNAPESEGVDGAHRHGFGQRRRAGHSDAVPARLANRQPANLRELHSENAENWYKEGEKRYHFDYPDETLREWANGLKHAAEKNLVDDAFIFFNNCVGNQLARLEITAEEYGRTGIP